LQQLINRPQLSPAMRVPMQVVYFAVELGVILTMVRLIQKYIVIITEKAKKQAVLK
jgi:TRAP-type C4-dicarboxylate transport system permease small subunit